MNNQIKYTNAPSEVAQALTRAKRVEDFLPSPEELVKKYEKERITIAINKSSLKLFKDYAKKNDAKYQTMINDVIESYAEKYLTEKIDE